MKLLGDLGSNPVQAHIEMRFQRVANAPQQLETVLDDLQAQAFDPARSRVLVFVRTRRQAEETTLALKALAEERNLPWAGQVDFFHAGLDGHDRADKYEAYKSAEQPADKTVVLVATKAFGMGMDIGNIHYLYHLGPSSTFEDFLQEVGRAGRDKALRELANFKDRPIRAMCVITNEDFGKLRDLQHRSDLSWDYLARVQEQVHTYVQRFRPLATGGAAFTLPLDLGAENAGPDGVDEASTKFRLALHWLEELGRIRLGMYTPASLPLRLLDQPAYRFLTKPAERQEVEDFVAQLHASSLREGNELLLPVAELLLLAKKRRWSELIRLLYQAQQAKALHIARYLTLTITDLRQTELAAWKEKKCKAGKLPLVEAVFSLVHKLLNGVSAGKQRSIDGDEFDRWIREIGDKQFGNDSTLPHYMRRVYWDEVDRNNRKLSTNASREKLLKDWHKKRAKFALKIIRLLPHTRVQSELSHRSRHESQVVQLIYNGAQQNKAWEQPLRDLQVDLTKLLAHVVESGQPKFNYADLVLELGLEDAAPNYLSNLLFLARALGYLQSSGSLVPMGIELFLDDLATPDRRDQASKDYQVSVAFEEGLRLKELRLIALQCLANLKALDRQDAFIKRYFQCDSSEALLKLLEEYLPENHPSLAAFQKEALLKAEKNLSDQQQAVYEAPLEENMQVLAGPGSGKTHTLTLRVARLVQREKVPPEQILVLAYNRAVVVELKERLGKLFRALGYGRLIQRLHVHTFHSICRRCLGAELDGKDFDEWGEQFTEALNQDPGLLERKLGPIRYVFVDEFQDITQLRLDLLKLLAPPALARLPKGDEAAVRICVIGDPNQSIYGYERVKEYGKMSPVPYYRAFEESYAPATRYLSNNYRSYPAILAEAAKILVANEVLFAEMPQLEALRQPMHSRVYCEVLDCQAAPTDWKAKVQALLAEEYEPGKPYQQVAVMLRSNDEVFRAFNELRQTGLPADIALRIQGNNTSPLASREFHYMFESLQATPTAVLRPGFVERIAKRKDRAIAEYGLVWDTYSLELAVCLAAEFQELHEGEATYQDLQEFIQELARKDDGHFAKLYEKQYDKHLAKLGADKRRREVVLTTMHKVKGLEFDAVVIPPSLADFGFDKYKDKLADNLADLVQEERRLFYVAYTRARYRLVVLQHEREAAVAAGQVFKPEEAAQVRGYAIKEGDGKMQLYWWAQTNPFFDELHTRIFAEMKVGDSITLVNHHYDGWLLFWKSRKVGKLGLDAAAKLPDRIRLEGLLVSNIKRYTLAESLAYDAKRNKTYTDKWGPTARERGYIYAVDFAGYYQTK